MTDATGSHPRASGADDPLPPLRGEGKGGGQEIPGARLLRHPSGAIVAAVPLADGHWQVEARDHAGVAFALGVPPHFQHAESTGAALLLVGEYAGTHYSLAIAPTAEGFQFEFAERWNDRAAAAGKTLEVRIERQREGVAIAVGQPGQPPWEAVPGGFRHQPAADQRRAEYRFNWKHD